MRKALLLAALFISGFFLTQAQTIIATYDWYPNSQGWSISDGSRGTYQTAYPALGYSADPDYFYHYYAGGGPIDHYIYSPNTALEKGKAYQASVYVRVFTAPSHSFAMTCGANSGSQSDISTVWSGIAAGGYVQYTSNYYYPSFTGNHVFGFHRNTSGNPGHLLIDQYVIQRMPDMDYTSSTCVQDVQEKIYAPAGPTDELIMRIEVVTNNPGNQYSKLTVSEFDFNTNGTDDVSLIQNARLYFTGSSSTFATSTRFGADVASPSGAFSITNNSGDSIVLDEGTNYFWLVYDIGPTAVYGDKFDAECSNIRIEGTDRTPTTTAPAGYREVAGDYHTRTGATGNWTDNIWQVYDGSTWMDVTGYPTWVDGLIEVRSDATVTLDLDTMLDQTTIAGQLILPASRALALNNGDGDELTITGTVTAADGAAITAQESGTGILLSGTFNTADAEGLYGAGASISSTNSPALTIDNTSTVHYNGAIDQNLSNLSYGNLTLSGGSNKTLVGMASVEGDVNLNTAILQLGGYHLTLGTTSSINGTFSSTNMVASNTGVGELRKTFPSGDQPAFTFPVGDVTGTAEYSPLTLDLETNTDDGYVGVIVTDADHAQMQNPATANYLSRYYTLSNSLASYTYQMGFSYLAADVNGSEASMELNRYNAIWLDYSFAPGSNQLSVSSTQSYDVMPLSGDYTCRENTITTAGQTYYWTNAAGGDWATATNWTPNRNSPQDHDTLIFDGISANITNMPNQNLGQLVITGGSYVSFLPPNGSMNDLTLVSYTGGESFVIDAGSNLVLGGTTSGGSYWGAGIKFGGAGQTARIDGTLHLQNDASGADYVVGSRYDCQDAITTVNGNFYSRGNIYNANTGRLIFTNGASYGHFWRARAGDIPMATWQDGSSCGVYGYETYSGDVPSVAGQDLYTFVFDCNNWGGGTAQIIKIPLAGKTIRGNLELLDVGDNRVLYLFKDENDTIFVKGDFIINNTLAGNHPVSLVYGTAKGVVVVEGDFNFQDGEFRYCYDNTVSGEPVLVLKGDYNQTGGFTNTNTQGDQLRLIFDGQTTQNYINTVADEPDYVYTTVTSGSVLILQNSYSVRGHNVAPGKLDIQGTLNTGTNQVAFHGAAGTACSFYLRDNATLITANVNGIENGTTGAVSNAIQTRSYHSGANIEFNGSAAQNTAFPTFAPTAETCRNLTINNAAGVTMNTASDINITEVLYLTDGTLHTGSNRVIVQDPATSSIQGYSIAASSPYIDGNLRRYVNNSTDYDFPVGDASYMPLQMVNTSLTYPGGTYIDATYGAKAGDDIGTTLWEPTLSNTVDYSNIGANGIWTLTPSAAPTAGTYDLRAYIYNYAGLTDNEFALLSRPDGSLTDADWTALGALNPDDGEGRLVAHNYTLRKNMGSFSEKGIGEGSIILPVELTGLDYQCHDGQPLLEWATASEYQNDYFAIERSPDGQAFDEAGTVDGAGNSNVLKTYSYLDANYETESLQYYRLKQTDYNGASAYSGIISVQCYQNQQELKITSLYAKGKELQLEFLGTDGGQYTISLTDMHGTSLESLQVDHTNGQSYSIPANLPNGVYIVSVYNTNEKQSRKIIIEE